MGRPFGPGGTLRHGLLTYWATRITTRVAIKPRRDVKNCEREAWERVSSVAWVAPSSRDMVVYFEREKQWQLLFKSRACLCCLTLILVLVVCTALEHGVEGSARSALFGCMLGRMTSKKDLHVPTSRLAEIQSILHGATDYGTVSQHPQQHPLQFHILYCTMTFCKI